MGLLGRQKVEAGSAGSRAEVSELRGQMSKEGQGQARLVGMHFGGRSGWLQVML